MDCQRICDSNMVTRTVVMKNVQEKNPAVTLNDRVKQWTLAAPVKADIIALGLKSQCQIYF